EAEEQRRATIRLPTTVPATHDVVFEQAVSMAASLVQHVSHRGYLVRLIVGSSCSEFNQGDAHLHDLLRMLALCERCAPTEEVDASDHHQVEVSEGEGGTEIVVQSWGGAADVQPDHPTILINGQPVIGGFHGV
ncbi:MAG: hypothetical protein CV089_21950, partial [Nitrospira sp. WS110]|nr:hypothetical protein [Nitrospira sp. WS110]